MLPSFIAIVIASGSVNMYGYPPYVPWFIAEPVQMRATQYYLPRGKCDSADYPDPFLCTDPVYRNRFTTKTTKLVLSGHYVCTTETFCARDDRPRVFSDLRRLAIEV